MSFSDVATDRQKVVASSSSLEQVLQRARSGRVPTCMRDEIGKRAERAVHHALAKKGASSFTPQERWAPIG